MSLISQMLADGAQALFDMDDTSGTTMLDSAGANNGTYVNTPTLGVTGLVEGTAVSFALASSEEATIPGNALSTNGSFGLWFKWTAGTSIVRDNTSSGVTGWIIGFDSGGTFTVRVSNTTNIATSKTTAQVRDGNRHFLVVAKTGANVTVYLDNVSIGTSASAGNTSSSNPWHVSRNGSAAGTSDSIIDLIGIYPSALSAAQVSTQWNLGIQAGAMTGSASASGSATGTLRGAGALSGSTSSTSSITGVLSLTGGGNLTGSSTGSGSASGTLRGSGALVGSSTGAGSASGTMTVTGDLSGTASASAMSWGFLTAELPVRVTPTFIARWKSGLHVGVAKPELMVEVRAGRFNRRETFWDDAGYPIDAIIGTYADPIAPWQAFWEPSEPYVEVPGVNNVEITKTLDQKGIASAVITIDNIAYLPMVVDEEDGGGTYHQSRRGYLAPLRGYVAPGRTPLLDERGDEVDENEWFGKLNRKRQITVHEGYGDQMIKTFTGLIDEVDTTSQPGVIKITARNFGGVLVDEEFLGWNIDPTLRDPVVFIDHDDADDIKKGGYDVEASSQDTAGGFIGSAVYDGDSQTYWRSNDHTGAGNTEWIEIKVPEGRHEDFWLGTEYPDLDVYISIFARALADESDASRTIGGVTTPLTPNEWVDTGFTDEFANTEVPGTFGGIPFVGYIHHSSADVQKRDLDASYILGPGSIIRVSFRNLYDLGDEGFRAAVRSLYSLRRTLSDDAGANMWVRIGDVSDAVKVVLRWAGFKEWDVESAGVTLKKRIVANRGMKYMDLIDLIKEGLGYEFFVADPTDADESIGIPVFRKSHVVATDIDPVITVTDGSDPDDGEAHLLTSVDIRETDEPLAYIIRARGRQAKNGNTFGGDSSQRIMFIYRPPWSGEDSAGVIRHVNWNNDKFATMDDCRFAAWYLALNEGLESVAVGVQIPAFPGIDLDDIFVVQDLGTGITTRLQVRERRSTNQRGETTNWVMTLSGAITDTPDVTEIIETINASSRDG